MKIMGALLIIICGSCIGVIKTLKLKKREENLEIYLEFLRKIKTKISFLTSSLEEIIANDNNKFSIMLKHNIKTRNLPNAYKITSEEFFINIDDKKLAQKFIEDFGKYDCEKQINYLEMYIENIATTLENCKSNTKEKGKINIMFYSFISVAIVLVLV